MNWYTTLQDRNQNKDFMFRLVGLASQLGQQISFLTFKRFQVSVLSLISTYQQAR